MPKRLLVVDDDPGLRQVVKDYISPDDWEVEEAATGAEGLALATSRSYDVVLMDVKLPDGDGREFCRKLTSLPRMRQLIVFLMSGHMIATESKIKGLERGAVDYLTKPLILAELRARLNAIVRARREGKLRQAEGHAERP